MLDLDESWESSGMCPHAPSSPLLIINTLNTNILQDN